LNRGIRVEDHGVAGQEEAQGATADGSVDRAEYGARMVEESQDRDVQLPDQVLRVLGQVPCVMEETVQVAAGGKGPPVGGDDQRFGRPCRLGEGAQQVREQLGDQGVVALVSIQVDGGDAVTATQFHQVHAPTSST